MTAARAVAAALLPLALLAATPDLSAAPLPSGDHAFAFAGTWSCRTRQGDYERAVGTRSGDTIEVVKELRPRSGPAKPSTTRETYAYDAQAGVWRVELRSDGAVRRGVAPPWNENTWNVLVQDGNGNVERVRYDLISDGRRRVLSRQEPAGNGIWQLRDDELCVQGETLPASIACTNPNVAPYTIAIEQAYTPPRIPAGTPYGTVQVIVSLDADSKVVGTSIQASPSAAFNAAAMDAARRSTFQTAVRNCKPVAGSYIFAIEFSPP